ncbi:MAG: hypothetical protein QGH40_12860 [bacterium]|jgi:hypothetical protein|nr:hypothetical protein [bacterium]
MGDQKKTMEGLAGYAHGAWSGWIKYMFSKCEHNKKAGTLTIPKWAVDRWTRQSETPYSQLPDSEKDSDREEARRMLAIIRTAGFCPDGGAV